MNKVILKGNLTRDPEFRVAANGTQITKLGIATTEVWKDGNERKERTTFVDATAFGKRAETISKHCRKGDPILIEGKLQLDQWETDQGERRQKLGVILENFDFLNRREQRD